MLFELNPGEFVYPNVTVTGVYDGDTVYLDIDKGFHDWRLSRNQAGKFTLSYRLLRIDAPEIRPLATREAGVASRDYLAALVLGQRVIVQTKQDPDSFGRYLIEMWLPDGRNVNDLMMASGHATPYLS